MTKYVFQRILWMLPTLFGITLICFVVINLAPGSPVEIDDLLSMHVTQTDRKEAPVREVYFGPERGLMKVAVRTRGSIEGEQAGPMVIEEPDTTVVVPPGWTVRRDPNGTLRLSRRDA